MTTQHLRSLSQQSEWTETRANGPVRSFRPNAMLQPKQNLGKRGKNDVNWTWAVHDEVFWKGKIFITDHLWSPQDQLPLPLNVFPSHGFAFKFKHSPTRSFQTKRLTSWKVLGPLVVAKDLVHSMCHDRHVFSAKSAKNWLGLVFLDASVGSVTKKRLNLSPTPSSWSSAPNKVFCGAHYLLFCWRF